MSFHGKLQERAVRLRGGLRDWIVAPIHLSGFRWVLLSFAVCFLLRFVSPLAIRSLVEAGILDDGFAVVARAETGEFVGYEMSPEDQRKIGGAVELLRKRDFRGFTLRFEIGPAPVDTAVSTRDFVSIAIRKDSGLASSVYGKASPSPAGDPEIRLNSNGTWDVWTVLHEAEHWRLLDPCVKGWIWSWLWFCTDLIPAHDGRLRLRHHMFDGGDWVALLGILAMLRHLLGRPL